MIFHDCLSCNTRPSLSQVEVRGLRSVVIIMVVVTNMKLAMMIITIVIMVVFSSLEIPISLSYSAPCQKTANANPQKPVQPRTPYSPDFHAN